MQLSDANPLAHFSELDLLPRTIFAIGAVLFAASFFLQKLSMGLCGVGLLFFGVALKLVFDVFFRGQNGKLGFSVEVAVQFLLAAILAASCFYVTFDVYHNGELPAYIRPFSKLQP